MTASHAQTDVDVAILGTGFSGLCMAIKLQREGCKRFTLIERAGDVGGTWRDNDYPGAACDVPSHMYSLSFEPNPDWSRSYPTQPELYRYLQQIVARHGLRPHIRFDTTLLGADWDNAAHCWRISTSQGELTARSLVLGHGPLAEPKMPEVPGLESFAGKTFHSARWDHDYDLKGKRVAVIGTGASAIQFVPAIAERVARLDVYQRTPNWIIPREDQPYSETRKAMFRYLPFTRWLHRARIYWAHEARVLGMVIHPALMKKLQSQVMGHIRSQVKDPVLREKVTPRYLMGCKRILISNDWYPALQKPGVSLITEAISEIRPHGVLTSDGQLREVDCLIFGTGFYATENPIAGLVRGRDGRSLAEVWQEGEEAYLGTVVAGFPNLYLMVGPNTGLGHNSIVFMIEAQSELVLKMLKLADRKGVAAQLEVLPEVQQRYNAELQRKLAGSVWATGCNSWYKHRSGKITALWPGFTFGYWWRTRRFRPADYRVQSGA
jgi:cation diffusion facilitator CzcD-associated flavoprotein CzcO